MKKNNGQPRKIYCIDTSAILEVWTRWYPIEVFGSLYQKLDELINAGRLIAPAEVLHELLRQSDAVSQWATSRRKMFHDLSEDLQNATKEVLRKCSAMVNPNKMKTEADPFVVALARMKGGVVVTQETPSGNPERLMIPDACQLLKISCISIIGLMRKENWKF